MGLDELVEDVGVLNDAIVDLLVVIVTKAIEVVGQGTLLPTVIVT
jgi:hypothetical protein